MMTEQEKNVVECLMAFATNLLAEKSVEETMSAFMRDARIAFSPEGREQLENHLKAIKILKK